MFKGFFLVFLFLTLVLSFGCGSKKGVSLVSPAGGGSLPPEETVPDIVAVGSIPIEFVYRTSAPNRTVSTHRFYDTVDCTIDWGDDSDIQECTEGSSASHKYVLAGDYVVKIHGKVGRMQSLGTTNNDLYKVLSIGNTGLTSLKNAFQNYKRLISFEVGGGDTSKVTTTEGMFLSATNLQSFDSNGFDTSSVINMKAMFEESEKLTVLDVSGWDVSKVTNMSDMFKETELVEVDLTGWNTSSVTDMSRMFASSSKLESVTLSGLNIENVTNMSYMFERCPKLLSVDFSSATTLELIYMSDMFYNSTGLVSLDLSELNVSKVTSFDNMFSGATALSSLNLTGWVLKTPVTGNYNTFYNTTVEPFCDQATVGTPLGATCK